MSAEQPPLNMESATDPSSAGRDLANWSQFLDTTQWDLQEISQILFNQFQLGQAGSTRLAGCHFEYQPVIELKAPGQRTAYYDSSGRLPDDLPAQLRLDECEPVTLEELLKREPATVDLLVDAIRSVEATAAAAIRPAPPSPPPTVYWCPQVTGKLNFVFGEQRASLDFRGWAQQLVHGLARIPAYYCPATETSSYSLDADDEGDITCAEAIATSSRSRRRLLRTKLRQCSVTGELAEPQFLWQCPESLDWVFEDLQATCRQCGTAHSPTLGQQGICPLCQNLASVPSDSPWVAAAMAGTPQTSGWRNWRVSQGRVYAVVWGCGWLRKRVWVFDVAEHGLLRKRVAWRLFNKWSSEA